jgi:hypothetical protein
MAGAMVAERLGNVLVLGRRPEAAALRQAAIDRLRERVALDSILYAVRRAHDPGFGWLVVDFVLIDGCAVTCITADVARALGCFDPAREVGVKLRGAAGPDILGEAIDGRLSTLVFGMPGALRHALIG